MKLEERQLIRVRLLQFAAAIMTFGAAMTMTLRASADTPILSYYAIAASGCATTLSAWKNGDTWITGCGSSGDNMISELVRSPSQPEQFQTRNFSAKQVAVDPASNTAVTPTVWALTTAGALYEYAGSQAWTKYFNQPACTRAFGVGWNKEVWLIGCDNTIYYLGATGTFISKGAAPEAMAQVAVPLNGGNPWFIAQSGDIYMFSNIWTQEPGCATSIGIGGDGVPWVTGCGTNSNGNVFQWNGSSFAQVLWNRQLNFASIRSSYENIPWGIGDGTTYPVGTVVERTAELDAKVSNVPQVETNWCWAAAAQSVYNYLTDSVTITPQCVLVGETLGLSGCCNANQPCNVTGNAFNMFNYLGVSYTRKSNTPELWEGLVSNLSANSPVVMDYFPSTGPGHTEVAEGMYAFSGTQYVERWNPNPLGVGTWETVAYPQFVNPTGFYTKWTYDAIHN